MKSEWLGYKAIQAQRRRNLMLITGGITLLYDHYIHPLE